MYVVVGIQSLFLCSTTLYLPMLAALFRQRPSLPITPIPKQVQFTLFKKNPPWWARWALVLVALDVMVASVFLL